MSTASPEDRFGRRVGERRPIAEHRLEQRAGVLVNPDGPLRSRDVGKAFQGGQRRGVSAGAVDGVDLRCPAGQIRLALSRGPG